MSGEDILKVKKQLRQSCLCCWIRGHFTHDLFAFLLQFFAPLRVSKILLECSPKGGLNGEGDVYFRDHQDALSAMSRDGQHIGETVGESLGGYLERFVDFFPI